MLGGVGGAFGEPLIERVDALTLVVVAAPSLVFSLAHWISVRVTVDVGAATTPTSLYRGFPGAV